MNIGYEFISNLYFLFFSFFLQTAIPIIIGTKFDDFVRLPPDLQWTIVTQVIKYFPQNCFIR